MQSKSRILPLDGVRGVAVLAVLLYHLTGGHHSSNRVLQAYSAVTRQGWNGVTLFFVLSGFLITGILWDSRGEQYYWRNFYVRRSVRIFPLYYLALVLALIGAWHAGTLVPALHQIVSPALFLQDIPGWFTACITAFRSPMALNHFWSLAVEEHFYLVWPVLLLVPKTRASAEWLCLATMAACLVCYRFGSGHLPLVLIRGWEMALGSWLAIAYRGPHWMKVRRAACWFLPAGVLGYVAALYMTNGASWLIPMAALISASLLVRSMAGGILTRMMSARWLRSLGGISYGVYVYHGLLYRSFDWITTQLVGSPGSPLWNVMKLPVTIACTLPLAWASYRFFEEPIRRYGQQRFVIQPKPSIITADESPEEVVAA